MTLQCGIYSAFAFSRLCEKIASASKRARVDFIPADDVLEKIFDSKNFADGMNRVEDSDTDRQLENETEESR